MIATVQSGTPGGGGVRALALQESCNTNFSSGIFQQKDGFTRNSFVCRCPV
jgi:hypothetical protein